MAKTMKKMNFKIQMLAENSLKIRAGVSSQISMTLVGNVYYVACHLVCIPFPSVHLLKLKGKQDFVVLKLHFLKSIFL